mmetsp:Transcript_25131/g.21979  ORF Transcript_25131/g.21979 Transcript_25131/m.21979 type:complete len:187 (+) Transcript_25131:146-706(+)
MNPTKLSIISFIISMVLLVSKGDDNPGFPDTDNCVFMFRTNAYSAKAVPAQTASGVDITIRKPNEDDNETTRESFSADVVNVWSNNYNNEDLSSPYTIKQFRFAFYGPFDLNHMTIQCGSETNIGTKILTLSKSQIDELTDKTIGASLFSDIVNAIYIGADAWLVCLNKGDWSVKCLKDGHHVAIY